LLSWGLDLVGCEQRFNLFIVRTSNDSQLLYLLIRKDMAVFDVSIDLVVDFKSCINAVDSKYVGLDLVVLWNKLKVTDESSSSFL